MNIEAKDLSKVYNSGESLCQVLFAKRVPVK